MLGKVLIALLVLAGGFVLYQLVRGKGSTAMAAPAVNGTWPSNYGGVGTVQTIRAIERQANTGAGHF